MMSASEMEGIKAQIMAIVVPDSEDVFDDSNESEALQITVRIACEFFGFCSQTAFPNCVRLNTWPKRSVILSTDIYTPRISERARRT